jgi:hypothetical protein
LRETPVDFADQAFEVIALLLVVTVLLAAGHRDLHHDVLGRAQRAFLEQLADRADALLDALRVVESVDAEQQQLWITEVGAYLA